MPAVRQKGCSYSIAPEQKARMTYDNILRFADDPDVRDPIKFLREREIVHFQRFGEANHTHLSRNESPVGRYPQGIFSWIRGTYAQIRPS